MKADKLLVLALFLNPSSQYLLDPVQQEDVYDDNLVDQALESYLDVYEAPNTVMTAAATPELEIAEK